MGHAQTVGGQFHKRFPECSVKGHIYERGHNLEPSSDDPPTKKKGKTAVQCQYCGMNGHKTNRTAKCKYFRWGKSRLEAEMVSNFLINKTAVTVGLATAGEPSEVHSKGTCNLFVSLRTQATCNFAGTQSTCTFYADDDFGEAVEIQAVGNALETMTAEILELDTIGFDEPLPLDRTVDM
jgi:hypothetical protein